MNPAETSAASSIERVTTADGASIAIKRRPNAGGQPVIFLHGLAVNADLWNLPEIRGPSFHYRSLASILHAAGYDLWLANLRGHGQPHMLSEPPAGQADWSVDHFILYDLPAVVDHVRQTTRQRPFIIGSSMGSMTAAGYVQGARLERGAAGDYIVADAGLAAERGRQLAGCVLVEFPAALRWPTALYDEQGRLNWAALAGEWPRTDADANFAFELLSRWSWLNALVAAAGAVPLGWLRPESDERWWSKLPPKLAEKVASVEKNAVQAMLQLAGTFTGGTNHRAEVFLHGRRYIMDAMKAGVLRQMSKSVRAGAFVSELGCPDHVYSDHYGLVTVPTLVIVGGRDRIANANVTREVFFERIASPDKVFQLYEEIAHGEFEAAPIACDRVYPEIARWIADRTDPQPPQRPARP